MNATPNTLLELRGVKLRFADKVVLNGVDLSVKPQEVLVVMGLSGGGKSTLLSILLGLLKANAGSIRFKKDEMTKLSRPALNRLRTRIGMGYQNTALVSSMNVPENMALPLEGLSHTNARETQSLLEQK